MQPGLLKGSWLPDEDDIVKDMVTRLGVGKVKWSDIARCLPGV